MSNVPGIPLFTISRDEARLVDAAAYALHCNEAQGHCVWLVIEAEHRTWVIETETGRFEHVIHESHTSHAIFQRWLPVSQRIIAFALSLDDEPAELSLFDDTIVATSEHLSAAIDLIDDDDVPGFIGDDYTIDAVAVLTVARLNLLFATARLLPTGVLTRDMVMPPMWLQFSDGGPGDIGELGAHVDWSDSFQNRSTFRAATNFSHGNATVPVLPGAFTMMLELLPGDTPVSIHVGTVGLSDVTHLLITDQTWKFSVPAPNPLLARWSSTIERYISEDDDAVVLERDGTEWTLGVDDSLVRLSLHHGHPDMARLAAVVVNGVDTTTELLLELNQLNLGSTSLRYCLADSAVRVLVDVPCTHLDRLVGAAREAVAAVRQYMDVLGPLAPAGAASR